MSEAYDRAPVQPGGAVGSAQRESRSIGDLLGNVSRDVTTLMRQEVALAKAEAKESASQAGKGVGLLAGAAVAGLLFLVFASIGLWWSLGNVMDSRGWAAVVVAALWAVIGAVLAAMGKKELERLRGLPQTADTVGKIPNALKGQEENNR